MDTELVRKAAAGDSDAFEQLVLSYEKPIYNLCLRMCGNADDAMDLTQETFLKAWRSLGSFRADAAFSTWLYRLCSNLCIDHLRREQKRKILPLHVEDSDGDERPLDVPDPAAGPEERLSAQEDRQQVADALQSLEPEYREALTLRVLHDLSYADIAAVLQVREGTVKSRIARAREKMREAMQKLGNKSTSPSSKQTRHERRDAP